MSTSTMVTVALQNANTRLVKARVKEKKKAASDYAARLKRKRVELDNPKPKPKVKAEAPAGTKKPTGYSDSLKNKNQKRVSRTDKELARMGA